MGCQGAEPGTLSSACSEAGMGPGLLGSGEARNPSLCVNLPSVCWQCVRVPGKKNVSGGSGRAGLCAAWPEAALVGSEPSDLERRQRDSKTALQRGSGSPQRAPPLLACRCLGRIALTPRFPIPRLLGLPWGDFCLLWRAPGYPFLMGPLPLMPHWELELARGDLWFRPQQASYGHSRLPCPQGWEGKPGEPGYPGQRRSPGSGAVRPTGKS